MLFFKKLDSPGAPKPTLGPKTPLKYPRRAEIGINASHAVQLTSFGPKKPDSNRSPQRSVPFTWNHPEMASHHHHRKKKRKVLNRARSKNKKMKLRHLIRNAFKSYYNHRRTKNHKRQPTTFNTTTATPATKTSTTATSTATTLVLLCSTSNSTSTTRVILLLLLLLNLI